MIIKINLPLHLASFGILYHINLTPKSKKKKKKTWYNRTNREILGNAWPI